MEFECRLVYANDNFDLSEMFYFLLLPSSVLLDSFVLTAAPSSGNHVRRFLSRLVCQDGNPDRQIEGFQSSTWDFFGKLALSQPTLHEILLDRNSSGLNLKSPLRFFARVEGQDSSLPSFGLIAMVKDPRKTDGTLAEIAESLGISKKKGKGTRYGKDGFPLEIGRKGRVCYLIGVAPSTKGNGSIDERLKDFQSAFLTSENAKKLPSSLKVHLNQSSDLA